MSTPRDKPSFLSGAAAMWILVAGAIGSGMTHLPWWGGMIAAGALAAFVFTPQRRGNSHSTADQSGEPVAPAPPELNDTTAPRPIFAITNAIDTPVIGTTTEGEVRTHNRAAAELFGDPSASLVGRSIEELFTQADVLGLHAAAAAGRARRGQARLRQNGTTRMYEVGAIPISAPDGGDVRVVLELRDITDLAAAVQLKTDFVANASHEFRTPLASIRAAVETLADGAFEDPGMRKRLEQMITGNVTRLEDLTRDLLDLSRLESPDLPVESEPVVISEIAHGLRDDFARIAGERQLRLVLDLDPALDGMETDAKLLTLVLRNLLDNAVKFAYEDTDIRLVGRIVPPNEPNGRAGARIQVIDRGVGIPLSQQQRIFERFYQVDLARTGASAASNRRRGTGLGLAIVKHALKALGGSVSVTSVWKEGTTMSVDIPRCLATIKSPPAKPRGDTAGR